MKKTLLLIASAIFSQVAIAQQANFSGISNGQTICPNTPVITLTADNVSIGTFNGPGVSDNGNGTATLNPASAGMGNISINYVASIEFIEIAAGVGHNLGIKSDGTLWAWGFNGGGLLGDGTTINRTYPVQIGTDNNWSKVAVGSSHNLALKKDGTLWSWGGNSFGQLGNGTTTDTNIPAQVGTANNWSQITASAYHSLAIKSNGTLWAWGWNPYGQLGDGTTIQKTTPVQIGTGTNWSQITTGGGFSLGLKNDGSRWGWGYNGYGNFGDGNNTNSLIPVQCDTETNWSQISAGYLHGLGMKNDGTIWGWGDNNFGQLTTTPMNQSFSPIQIGTANNWTQISAEENHSLGIKSDGTLWGWGHNGYSQLGDGTTNNSAILVQIGTSTNWSQIFPGKYHSIGLKNDGTLWAWGNNANNQLGDSTAINRTSPTLINTATTVSLSKTITIVTAPSNAVTLNGITLTAVQSGATYQWINCNNGNAIIPGATAQSFTPTANGSYAVIVTNANCSDTSACQVISSVGIDEQNASTVKVYPNPTNGQITVEFFGNDIRAITMLNALGQRLQELNVEKYITKINMELPVENGVYFLELRLENTQTQLVKLIKN
jgi:alpha-tubulin suppressor-like RCC1 family protein